MNIFYMEMIQGKLVKRERARNRKRRMQYQGKTLRNFGSIPKGNSRDTPETCPDNKIQRAFPSIVSEGIICRINSEVLPVLVQTRSVITANREQAMGSDWTHGATVQPGGDGVQETEEAQMMGLPIIWGEAPSGHCSSPAWMPRTWLILFLFPSNFPYSKVFAFVFLLSPLEHLLNVF